MATKPARFQTGEYVILTPPYLGLPAQSVGVITRRYSPNAPLYLIYFGVSLPVGPFPAAALSRLRLTHAPRTPPHP